MTTKNKFDFRYVVPEAKSALYGAMGTGSLALLTYNGANGHTPGIIAGATALIGSAAKLWKASHEAGKIPLTRSIPGTPDPRRTDTYLQSVAQDSYNKAGTYRTPTGPRDFRDGTAAAKDRYNGLPITGARSWSAPKREGYRYAQLRALHEPAQQKQILDAIERGAARFVKDHETAIERTKAPACQVPVAVRNNPRRPSPTTKPHRSR